MQVHGDLRLYSHVVQVLVQLQAARLLTLLYVLLRAQRQGGVRSASGGNFIIYRDELSSFRRFSASCVRIWRPFFIIHKSEKSVFARPRRDSWDVARLVGTPRVTRAHASATSTSLRPHPYLLELQGEQAALQMILAHFAARAASFFRQGSLPTPGVQRMCPAYRYGAGGLRRWATTMSHQRTDIANMPGAADRHRIGNLCIRGRRGRKLLVAIALRGH